MLACVSLILFLLAPVSSLAVDAIFVPSVVMPNVAHDVPVDRFSTDEVPPWLLRANRLAAEVVVKFLGGLVADRNGVEHPNPDEYPIDYFTKQLGESNFKFLMQGVGNLKYLGGIYYYNELQGGFGVEYNFIMPDDSDYSTTLAVRITPLYGEISLIRTGGGAPRESELPNRAFVGSSIGIEAAQRFGRFEPGVRAYARAETEVGPDGYSGVSVFASAYMRVRLSKQNDIEGRTLYLTPVIAFYDRGDAKEKIYRWNANHEVGPYRSVRDIRQIWDAQLKLELRY